MFLSRLFRKKPDDDIAHRLYVHVADQARQPVFYREGGVRDSLDGRFDMLALHLFLVLRRLGGNPADRAATLLGQQLFDVMFGDMDRSLREMGVGDLTVGKRIRDMSEAFYGRVQAYEAGLQDADSVTLMAALERNLYRGTPPAPGLLASMATYVRELAVYLQGRPVDEFLAGELNFAIQPRFS